MSFGNRIRQRRQALGLIQEDLASRIGVSQGSIQRWEGGDIPKGDYLLKIAQALDCSTDWLLTGHGPLKRIEGEPADNPDPGRTDMEVVLENFTKTVKELCGQNHELWGWTSLEIKALQLRMMSLALKLYG